MNRHHDPSGNTPETDGYVGYSRDYDRTRSTASSRPRQATGRGPSPVASSGSDKRGFNLDVGSLLRPASRRWYWLFIGGFLGAAAGAALGLWLFKVEYAAGAQLVRYDPPVASDAYRPQVLNGPTLVAMIRSPEIFSRIGPKMSPPTAGPVLLSRVTLGLERNSEIVNVSARGPDPKSAVALANHYNREVIDFTRAHQRREATEADGYVAQLLKDTEVDLAAARKELPTGVATALSSLSSTPIVVAGRKLEQIQAAEEELARLLITYTDIHPFVRKQREVVARLRAEIPAGVIPNKIATAASSGADTDTINAAGLSREQLELAAQNVRFLENIRTQLVMRQRAIQVFKQNPPGTFRPMQEASMDTVMRRDPWVKIGMVAAFFGMLGLAFAGGEVLRRELFDNRLKTEDDVARVTGLPVLGHLGDIRQMSLSAREAWAFRTWIALQDRLAYSPNHGLICGITSSNSGDGRSLWISLLAGAARKCGFRVLTIATRSTGDFAGVAGQTAAEAAEPVVVEPSTSEAVHVKGANGTNGHAVIASTAGITRAPANGANGTALLSNPLEFGNGARAFSSDSEFTALTASALFTPAMVTEKLMGPESDPLVHIPLPGWTWNLERRKQWQGALNVWRKIDNVVILVELPPASMPESVLLASNLPNLAWLVESGKSEASETRAQLETLRHARCNLVGAFINRALTPMTHGKLSRWVNCLALCALVGLAGPKLIAADTSEGTPPQVPTATLNNAFSVVSPVQRAAWQQKLTLGPGDVLTFSLFGEEKEMTRKDVPIGPDGRVSYLEAQNIKAAGLTVDELRDRLNEELGKYRRAPQAYVVPVSYKSKKYYVLGKVTQRGSFPLDRPLTLIEAVAMAKGMETGVSATRGSVELADLSRSFVARAGRKLDVDFEKLFLGGDLTQNVALEPDDYVYFPGTSQSEVFVLGAVRLPGAYSFSTPIGAVGAVAARGGFTDRAWKQQILVIRGALGHPETFVVDAKKVLGAQSTDVTLQPRDIIYVSERPWTRGEDLLDAAAQAFVTSVVVSWTGIHVAPPSFNIQP